MTKARETYDVLNATMQPGLVAFLEESNRFTIDLPNGPKTFTAQADEPIDKKVILYPGIDPSLVSTLVASYKKIAAEMGKPLGPAGCVGYQTKDHEMIMVYQTKTAYILR